MIAARDTVSATMTASTGAFSARLLHAETYTRACGCMLGCAADPCLPSHVGLQHMEQVKQESRGNTDNFRLCLF